MAERVTFNLSAKEIAKEGWLQKKKVNLRTWSKRYFYLLHTGRFIGFKEKPPKEGEVKLCNNFSILDAKISSEYDSKYYYINLRCFQMDTQKPVQRIFGFTAVQERDDWLDAIKKVSVVNKGVSGEGYDKNETSDNFIQSSSIRTIKDYKLQKVLGEGSFGKVVLCSDRLTREVFAIKGIDKKRVNLLKVNSHVEEEIKVMKTINHPFLTHMKCCFEDERYIYLVMEFVQGGEVFHHLNNCKFFSESRTRLYVAEIALALDYLHSKDIIYRDIKLENIMLDDAGHIKLTDFGLCKTDVSRKLAKTFCGTPEYLAPEFTKMTYYGIEVDWWSLGVVCYEMLTGQALFSTPHNTNVKKVLELICNTSINFSDYWKKRLSEDTQNFTLSLLIKDPTKRLGAKSQGGIDAIKSHAFFKYLNWEDVINRKIIPEYIPCISGKYDTSQFDTMFTDQHVDFSLPEICQDEMMLDDEGSDNNPEDNAGDSKDHFEMKM